MVGAECSSDVLCFHDCWTPEPDIPGALLQLECSLSSMAIASWLTGGCRVAPAGRMVQRRATDEYLYLFFRVANAGFVP